MAAARCGVSPRDISSCATSNLSVSSVTKRISWVPTTRFISSIRPPCVTEAYLRSRAYRLVSDPEGPSVLSSFCDGAVALLVELRAEVDVGQRLVKRVPYLLPAVAEAVVDGDPLQPGEPGVL